MKQERFDWLADNPFYTKRFTFHIGRRCRNSSIQDVAKEHLLDWKTVKALEMEVSVRSATPGTILRCVKWCAHQRTS